MVLIGLLLGSVRLRPRSVEPVDGSALAGATLLDLAGSPVRLRTLLGRQATVLVFTGIDCPLGNLYKPRLVELAEFYRGRGVVFIGINSNATESAEQVLAHAQEFRATFPVLKDPGNVVADLALAQRTCEALVLDRDEKVRYRGAIDDQYEASKHFRVPTGFTADR
jgi:thiol-disulfide isomerase/thioredoxin